MHATRLVLNSSVLLQLPPLQEAFLRRLLQLSQFSAAAAFMTSALHGAGGLQPGAMLNRQAGLPAAGRLDLTSWAVGGSRPPQQSGRGS